MDKTQSKEIAREVLRDKSPIVANINIADAWLLLGSIQEQLEKWPELATTVKTQLLAIAGQLQVGILRIHPEAKDLIAGGWDFVETEDEIREQIDRFLVSANDPKYR